MKRFIHTRLDTVNKLKQRLLSDFNRTNEQHENFLREHSQISFEPRHNLPSLEDSGDETLEDSGTVHGVLLAEEEEEDDYSLTLKSVNFVHEDRKLHHTSEFQLMDGKTPTPIFRRGQTFSLKLNFNKAFKPEEDRIYLVLSYGPNASFKNGTKFKIALSKKGEIDVEQWTMWISETKGFVVTLKVYIPTKSLVGVWRYQINLSEKGSHHSDDENAATPENIMYILFNPWCKDDDVYLEEENLRKKYVLNDHGAIYRGAIKMPVAQQWVFGQFDYAVLPAVVLLLERSGLKHPKRGSAFLIARAISAVVNAPDEGGLVVGRWDGNYGDGYSPNHWTGSTAIFEEYLSTGGNSVKYGQCWVFASCITTACRALGIPCRLITCYNSAVDNDKSLTVDMFFDRNMATSQMRTTVDSIWNYHCWNETWFTRPDLPPIYNGWQIVDGTPQSQSGGKYRSGPAPQKAILEGDVGLMYDVGHAFSEVNSDMRYFIEDSKSTWGFSLYSVDTEYIGKLIVTESIKRTMEDVTNSYKYKEGSKEEREIFKKALKGMSKAQDTYYEHTNKPTKPTEIKFTVEKIASVTFGETFEVTVKAKNESEKPQTVEFYLYVSSVFNTGVTIAEIKQGREEVVLGPNAVKVVKMIVSVEEYQFKMDHSEPLIRADVRAFVADSQQAFHNEETFHMVLPVITIEAPKTVKTKEAFKMTFSFTNPMDKELTNCVLTIESPGLLRPQRIPLRNLRALDKMVKSLKLKSMRRGEFTLVANFSSNHLSNINGHIQIKVVDENF